MLLYYICICEWYVSLMMRCWRGRLQALGFSSAVIDNNTIVDVCPRLTPVPGMLHIYTLPHRAFLLSG